MYLLFRISIKFLQENNYIRNILNGKSNCFHYLLHKKKCNFSLKYLCHNYVRRHSRMRQIAPFKTIFFARTCCLSNVFQDQETTNSLKMIPRCLNMDLRPCPRVTYALDISVQAMRFSLPFLLTIYTNFYTFNALLLNNLIYTNFFHSYIQIM